MNEGDAGFPQDLQALAHAAQSTFWGFMGCRLEHLSQKKVTISLKAEAHHLNMLGILHGGVHATLLDNAMGLAAMIARPNERVVTTNLNIHYVAPGRKGKILAHAEIVHMTRRIITVQGRVESEEGNLLAFGTGSFRVTQS